MNKIDKEYSRRVNEQTKYRVYCNCGHSMVIYPFEHKNKKICSWCGNYVYKNNVEKFKDLLIKKRKRLNYE